jgi:tetratricopeptide (TPR) repeat protein
MLLFAQEDTRTVRSVRAALERGKPYKALRVCNARLEGESPEEVFRALRAEAFNAIGEYAKAREDAELAVQQYPADQAALYQLAIAEQHIGWFAKAQAHFHQVLAQGHHSDAPYRLGQCQMQLGQLEAAAITLQQGIPNAGTAISRSRYERALGECFAQLQDSAQARASLRAALASNGEDPVIWNSMGYYGYAWFNEHARAIECYSKAIKLDPNYSYPFNNRGWSRFSSGDLEGAMRDIRMAARKKASNPAVYRNMGLIALKQGDIQAACAHFKEARALGYTALHGGEVEELLKKNCPEVPEVVPATFEAAPSIPPRTNAP